MKPILASELDDIFDDDDIIELENNIPESNIIYSLEGFFYLDNNDYFSIHAHTDDEDKDELNRFTCSLFDNYSSISKNILINYGTYGIYSNNFLEENNIYNIDIYGNKTDTNIFHTKCKIVETGSLRWYDCRYYARFDTIEPKVFNNKYWRNLLLNYEDKMVNLTIEKVSE